MMADNWTFSNLTLNDTSYFSPSVVANDLHGVQEFTDMILNPVVKEHNLLPPNIIETLNFTDLDPFIEAIKNDYSTLFEQNTALTAMVVIGFTVALLIPISGIISCIVYCCCGGSKKGGQKQKTDSLCLCMEGVIYLLLLVLGWLGVAWLVVSDLGMQKGIEQLPDTFDG